MTKMLSFTDDLKLPIDLLMQPIGLLGNRGGGKTYSGTKLFESAHDAGVQCIAVDIVGKWWALRLGADGKPKGGLSDVFIFGGKHADFPITPDQGAFVAKVVAERRIHVVLDVSLMRKGDRRRFLTDFAEEYFLLKKQEEVPTPCVLFVEEAHAVLPQKPGPDEMRMLGAFQDLVAEGRNAGIGVVIMDQRPATCNKNALALVEVLIILRTTYKSDRDVYTDWVVQKGEDEGGSARVELNKTLPFLKTGQAYLYAPQFELFKKIQISPKRTFDSSATVKIGAKSAVVGTLTPVDVEQLKGDMAVVLEKAKADDPRALRAQVAALQQELTSKRPPAPAAKPERVEVPALTAKQMELLRKVFETEAALLKAVIKSQEKMWATLNVIEPALRGVVEHQRAALATEGVVSQAVIARRMGVEPRHSFGAIQTNVSSTNLAKVGELGAAAGDGRGKRFVAAADFQLVTRSTELLADGRGFHVVDRRGEKLAEDLSVAKLKAGARRMAGVLASYPEGLTRKNLGALSGITPTSGTMSEYMNTLIRAGIVAVTAGGLNTSTAVPLGTTWADVLERWSGDFKLGARNMLSVLRQHGAMTRAELGALVQISPTSGTMSEYVNSLKRSGIVDEQDHRVFITPRVAELP